MNRYDIVIFHVERSRISSIAARCEKDGQWESVERSIRVNLRPEFIAFTVPAGEYMAGDYLKIQHPN